MNWLIKISQINSQQLVQEYLGIYNSVRDQQRKLKDQLEIQKKPATSYIDQVKQTHEQEVAIANLNQPLIEWITSHLPQIWQIEPKTRDTFIQELERLQKIPEFNPEDYENYFDEEVLEWYLDNGNIKQVIELLNKNNIQWDETTFPTGKKVITAFIEEDPSEWYVIEPDTMNYEKDANQWVRDAAEKSYLFYSSEDNFWDGISDGSIAYHATQEENKASILKHGIWVDSKTRGMSNRGTPNAVFASWNIESISSYGDTIFSIDLGAMKRDKYMPEVYKEEPIQEEEIQLSLASAIGIEDYYVEGEAGIDPETIVIYDNIPPKYLSLVRE